MNGKTTKKSAAKTSEQQTKGTSGKKQNNLNYKKKKSALVPKNGVDSILVIYVFSSWHCIDLEK